MESAAMQQVLESPEHLTRICEIIQNDKALALVRSSLPSAARVNSWWRDIIYRILWAEPPAEALATVRRRRRQIYASHIKTLGFNFEQDPTLNTLSLVACNSQDFKNLCFSSVLKTELGMAALEAIMHGIRWSPNTSDRPSKFWT
jgi:hypothetical protein